MTDDGRPHDTSPSTPDSKPEPVGREPELRFELERIAASVGDPPEHGLDRVAARRHRRLRRRRGAVATAAVLAVLIVGVVGLDQRRDPDDAVTADDIATLRSAPPELPELVDVVCEPAGVSIPVASVRPERDGLHVRVVNSLGVATVVTVTGDGWRSGDIPVAPGTTEIRQPVPPGEVTIGCEIGGEMQRHQVALVDAGDYYREPELECDDAGSVTLRGLPVVEPGVTNMIAAARIALGPYIIGGTARDGIGPLRGYVGQRLDDATADPVVQVARDGSVIGFAHVRGPDNTPTAPWVEVSRFEMCASLRTDAALALQPAPEIPSGESPDPTGSSEDGTGGPAGAVPPAGAEATP